MCVCFSGEEIRKKASILFGIQFDKKRYEDLVNLLDTIKKYKDLVRDFQYFLYFLLKRIFKKVKVHFDWNVNLITSMMTNPFYWIRNKLKNLNLLCFNKLQRLWKIFLGRGIWPWPWWSTYAIKHCWRNCSQLLVNREHLCQWRNKYAT